MASVGFPGLAAFDARTAIVEGALPSPFSIVALLATLAPIGYYGRLLVIGLSRPDRILEPDDAWRPVIKRVDLTALRPWLATMWTSNRSFTTAAIAFALAVVALATASGAFGGPAAAAERPPVVVSPNLNGAPAASGSPSPGIPSAEPSPTEPSATPGVEPSVSPSAEPSVSGSPGPSASGPLGPSSSPSAGPQRPRRSGRDQSFGASTQRSMSRS